MTALLPSPVRPSGPGPIAAWSIGAPRLLAGITDGPLETHAAHTAVHGPRPQSDLTRVLALLDAANLTGRGGAGFPLATKIRALAGGRRAVIVNGSESEPASRKDRLLLRRSPHLVLDGALTLAAAIEARTVTVAVQDEPSAAAVRRAISQRRDAKHVAVHVGDGHFVAGEARAVVRAIRRGPALPPGRRTPPTTDGRLVSNAETLAQLAVLLRLGPARFAQTGTPGEPGTTLLTVDGAVARPGVIEVPLGTPLHIVLAAAGGTGARHVVVGGYHGAWLPAVDDVRLSRAGLAAAGGTLGAGVVLVLDDGTCALGELARVAGWLAAQSTGRCGPCAFGLPALARDVAAAAAGHPTALANARARAASVTGRGACAHPDGAARFVTSGLIALGDELAAHARGGCGRPVLGQFPWGEGR